jgi:hypothetical protein
MQSANAYYINIAEDKKSIEVQYYEAVRGKWTRLQFDFHSQLSQCYLFESDQAYFGNPLRILLSYANQNKPMITMMFLSLNKEVLEKIICFDNMTSLRCSTQSYSLAVQEERFFNAHSRQLKNDKDSYFGIFARLRSSKVDAGWKLDDIYAQAQTGSNRTRKICVSLGWMHPDGQLTQQGMDLKNEAEHMGYRFKIQ